MNHLACLCIWVKAWFHLCHGTLTPPPSHSDLPCHALSFSSLFPGEVGDGGVDGFEGGGGGGKNATTELK